jgi:hypothetical protein
MALEKPAVTQENTKALQEIGAQMRERSLQLPDGFMRAAQVDMPYLDPDQVYERLIGLERGLASPSLSLEGYIDGAATRPDEILLLEGGDSRMLLSAEHATYHMRGGAPKEPDSGTAALVAAAHEDYGVHGTVMLGRQSSDANMSEYHPLKDYVRGLVADSRVDRYTSVHGIVGGKYTPRADRGIEGPFDAMIGIGNNPSEQTQIFASRVREVLADMGFTVGINQPFIKTSGGLFTPEITHKEEGEEYAYGNFKAAGKTTTRTEAEDTAGVHGVDLAAIQLELSDMLRIQPIEREKRLNRDGTPDLRKIIDGVYAGYWVMSQVVELGIQD